MGAEAVAVGHEPAELGESGFIVEDHRKLGAPGNAVVALGCRLPLGIAFHHIADALAQGVAVEQGGATGVRERTRAVAAEESIPSWSVPWVLILILFFILFFILGPRETGDR